MASARGCLGGRQLARESEEEQVRARLCYGGCLKMRSLISSGSPFEKTVGYSRAVVDGEWVFVSGTTGFDYEAMTISDDPVAQTQQAFKNIGAALHQAGASLDDVVRVHYIVPRADDWQKIAPVLGDHFGSIRPAATAIVAGLVDPRMLVEIEVTARRSRDPLPAKVSRALATNAFSPEPGLKRHVLANNPELMLVEHHMEQGWEGTRHSHPHHQLVYVISGHLRVDCGGRTFEVRAGDSFIVDGGVEHQAWALAPSTVLDVFTPTRQDYLP
jgi:enamine deaminase RidA (YjgF/YER057c/UK114 family)/quercetin dioxygenase-like cupin family protein